jgi:hypothetical protein
MDTTHEIAKLELERHDLYKLAGHNMISNKQRERIQEIKGKLDMLWDQHRREEAARRWGTRSATGRRNTSVA